MAQIQLGERLVGDDTDAFVIAEVGHNHQGDLELCKRLFKAAADAGAHAVKLQKRDNRTLFTPGMLESAYQSENAFGPTYGTHREALEFNREQYAELKEFAAELNVLFFSTAFDEASAEFLQALDMPAYKIASGDLFNIGLIKRVAQIGKPIIVSTGGGTLDDARRVYDAVMPINRNLVILQCTSGYPPAHEELNLRVIETFKREFPDIVVGFSSHDSGIAMPLIAYMMGARVIEKHFTIHRHWKGSDQSFSLEPSGLRRLVRDLGRARVSLGDGVKRPYPSEIGPLRKMQKVVVANGPLRADSVIAATDLATKIPADTPPEAFHPMYLEALVGRKLLSDVDSDGIITRQMVEDGDRIAYGDGA